MISSEMIRGEREEGGRRKKRRKKRRCPKRSAKLLRETAE